MLERRVFESIHTMLPVQTEPRLKPNRGVIEVAWRRIVIYSSHYMIIIIWFRWESGWTCWKCFRYFLRYLLAPAIRSKIYCNSLIKDLALVWLSYIRVCLPMLSICGSHFELVKLRLINEYCMWILTLYIKVENRGWEPLGLISVLCRWRVSVAIFLHSQVRWGLVESQLLWGYSSQPERGEMHNPV